MQLRRPARGFSLVELAVVLAIVGLLAGGAIMTLSAQAEQRNLGETRQRLDSAVEAVIAFAVINGRLPCPAVASATGDESFTGSGCTTWYGGYLPAKTIGFQPTDGSGYAVDAWGNRIRYAVSRSVTGCTGTAASPHFVSRANLKANGVSCRPSDLDICLSAAGTSASSCNGSANRAVTSDTVAFIVFSTGKDGATSGAYGPDEIANVDGNPVFVSHAPTGADSTAGSFDDLMLWVPAGIVYSKLIAAGVLP
jgi:prepilin-type N-terminal cleavage/methylation domain-containing protein